MAKGAKFGVRGSEFGVPPRPTRISKLEMRNAGLRPRLVAIDGPSGVGKSTVARRLGKRLGLPYLDTGKMYRAFGLYCLGRGVDLTKASAVAACLEGFELPDLGDPVLLGECAGEAASLVSQIPGVRERMVALQRAMGLRTGGVVEGRDATTRIFPDAHRKFFLFADENVRILRRWRETGGDWGETACRVVRRDKRDRKRAASPLVLAPDAVPVDTTALNADEVVDLLAFLCREEGL